jgi:hypothetical protein
MNIQSNLHTWYMMVSYSILLSYPWKRTMVPVALFLVQTDPFFYMQFLWTLDHKSQLNQFGLWSVRHFFQGIGVLVVRQSQLESATKYIAAFVVVKTKQDTVSTKIHDRIVQRNAIIKTKIYSIKHCTSLMSIRGFCWIVHRSSAIKLSS